jgi:hypothetical protein
LPCPNPLPQVHGHDAQFGRLDDARALLLRLVEGMALSHIGVLAIRLFAVWPTADIERVVNDTGAARGIAGQRIWRSSCWLAEHLSAGLAAARRRNALGVKPSCDGDGRQARGIIFEDAYDHRRFDRQDLLQAADAFAVAVVFDRLLLAVRRAAGALAHRMAAQQSIAHLHAGGAQLFGIDRAHYADV